MVSAKNLTKESLGKKLMPNKIGRMLFQDELEDKYRKLYFNNLDSSFITNFFALSILLSIIIFVFVNRYLEKAFVDFYSVLGWRAVIIFVSYFLLNLIVYYLILFFYLFYIDGQIKKNEDEIEEVLPEFLDNLVSNLKGGISLEKALLKSCTKEQKTMRREISLINQKIMMGSTSYDALNSFANRYDSEIIKRTFFLITEGLRFGGNIVEPLERISNNLKRIYELDSEIKANSGGFSIVIRAIAVFVAPLLFALALTILTFIGQIFGIMQKSKVDAMSSMSIPQEYVGYLITFSYAMILLITFFSSLITAHLNGDKIYTSVKYIPIYLAISIVLYKVISNVLLNFFGSII